MFAMLVTYFVIIKRVLRNNHIKNQTILLMMIMMTMMIMMIIMLLLDMEITSMSPPMSNWR